MLLFYLPREFHDTIQMAQHRPNIATTQANLYLKLSNGHPHNNPITQSSSSSCFFTQFKPFTQGLDPPCPGSPPDSPPPPPQHTPTHTLHKHRQTPPRPPQTLPHPPPNPSINPPPKPLPRPPQDPPRTPPDPPQE